jgi:8-oxo-dGTP diphosphatase
MTEPPDDRPHLSRQRIAAYGVCIERGRVLLVRASSALTVAGRWFLPGGGVEHGEDPVAALRREVVEETGLVVDTQALRGVLADVTRIPGDVMLHTVRIIYTVQAWSGTARPEIGGSSEAVRWVALGDIEQFPVMPYVRRAVLELPA